MSNQATIEYLKDKDGSNVILPVTSTKAVVDEDNVTVDAMLSNALYVGEPKGTTPIPNVNNGLHKYSEEEQIIGEWIDGKTVYEKTFEFQITQKNVWVALNNITNIERIISLTCWLGAWTTNLDSSNFKFNCSNNKIYININGSFYEQETQGIINVQYTKTTD